MSNYADKLALMQHKPNPLRQTDLTHWDRHSSESDPAFCHMNVVPSASNLGLERKMELGTASDSV
jgi:hypothetical protein